MLLVAPFLSRSEVLRDEELIPLTHNLTYHEEEQADIVSVEFVEKKEKKTKLSGEKQRQVNRK